jgi:uncharacterized protein YdaU (DUF1376 family)
VKSNEASDWMPFFGDDYWDSERVAAMDDSAALLYSWLLWRQWKHGPLPGPEVLRRLPHRWQANWDALWPQVEPCFRKDEDGRLVNERCAFEKGIAVELSEAKVEAGRKGGRATQARRAALAKHRSSTARAPLKQRSSAAQAQPQAQLNTRPNSTGQDTQSPVADSSPDSDPSPGAESSPCAPSSRGGGFDQADPEQDPDIGVHGEFCAWWCQRFLEVTKREYVFDGARDGQIVRELRVVTRGGIAEMKLAAENLFASAYWRREGFDLSTLRANFAKLLVAQPDAKPSTNGAARTRVPTPDEIREDDRRRAEKREREAAELAAIEASGPRPKLSEMLAAQRASSTPERTAASA